ncbi:peptide deformylase [Palleronia aestuarii]|uniref:Peptide deformylase n=1 Tax=Palleronia aestuarii TaxID=568105 RepID=A0A2W7P0X9_9RHOB|nr:peptide deformylase [Palleronia aestuarii]PZX19106.1 peptide deformylase [Palleronia aestuarii]
MSRLEILRWPDPRLTQVCVPVGQVTDDVRELASDMLETMYAAPGRGLAAPQVGRLIRLFVMDAGWKEGRPEPRICVDPVFLSVSDAQEEGEEGCLSIPGVTARIVRPNAVRMGWTDENGVARQADLDGAAARIAQHEMDHLDGIVTFDRVEDRAALEAAYDG